MRDINTSALVRKADASIDCVALFDILLIALMLTLVGSRFVLAPGLSMENAPLPSISASNGAVTDAELSVLSAKSPSMIIYDGAIFNMAGLFKKMGDNKVRNPHAVLLVKADKNVTAQTIIDIASAAKSAGFKRIQLAAKPTLPSE